MPCFGDGPPLRVIHEQERKRERDEGLKIEAILHDNFFPTSETNLIEKHKELNRYMLGITFLGFLDRISMADMFFICRRYLKFPVKNVKVNYLNCHDVKEIRQDVEVIVGQTIEITNRIERKLVQNSFVEFCRNHVMISVFEFLDMKTIIESCLEVSKDWINLILFDENFTSRVVIGRIKILMDKINGQASVFSIENMKSLYRNMTWIEIYILSGIHHLEICEKDIRMIIEKDTKKLYSLLKMNPFQFLNISERNILYKRLKNKSKNIMIINYEIDICKKYLKQIDGIVLTSSNYCLQDMLSIPIVLPINNSIGFSINFNEELQDYLTFLKEITTELMPLIQEDHAITVAHYLDNMRSKAHTFVSRRNPLQDYTVGNDVLIGLHLLLLDTKNDDNLLPIANISFGRLLQTRNSNIEMHQKFYPKKSRTDYYQDLIMSISNRKKKKWTNSPIFKRAINAIEFIQEHIFELVEIGQKLINDEQLLSKTIQQYHEFLKIEQVSFPCKEIDFIFHYHLLHPHHFRQDCKRISGFIKSHHFNFH